MTAPKQSKYRSQDIDIIQALNEREWKGARALIEGAVSAGTPLHSETLLLIAEKLDPDEREPPKRPRGSPGGTLERYFKMIAIGFEAEQAVNDKGKLSAIDVLEGVAEQHGLSRKTVEKYRKVANRLKKDPDLPEMPKPRADMRPQPERPARRIKPKPTGMRYRTEGVKKWVAGDIPRKFMLDGVSYEATGVDATDVQDIVITFQDNKGCPQSTRLEDVRLILPRLEENDG